MAFYIGLKVFHSPHLQMAILWPYSFNCGVFHFTEWKNILYKKKKQREIIKRIRFALLYFILFILIW
jgi:hypothetical protein